MTVTESSEEINQTKVGMKFGLGTWTGKGRAHWIHSLILSIQNMGKTQDFTHPFIEKELGWKGPVIHAQTVTEDHSLPGVGHGLLLCQEVVVEELFHPVEFVWSFIFTRSSQYVTAGDSTELSSICDDTMNTKGEGSYLRKVSSLILSKGTSSPGWRAKTGSFSSVLNTWCCSAEQGENVRLCWATMPALW